MTEIRPATDSDGPSVIALIAAVFSEYPGCVLDVPQEEPELLAVATAFSAKDGNFWVALGGSEIVGCVGAAVSGDSAVELKKMYVGKAHRRGGIGTRLLTQVEMFAHGRGARLLTLWSDSRFTSGHQFYARHGYERTGRSRQLLDLSNTTEFEFEKRLAAFARSVPRA